MGIGFAKGAPDTQTGGPPQQGSPTEASRTPGRHPHRGFCFSGPEQIERDETEDRSMYAEYLLYDFRQSDWRFCDSADHLITSSRKHR